MEIARESKSQPKLLRNTAYILCIVYGLYAWAVATQTRIVQWDVENMIWLQRSVSPSADAPLSLLSFTGSTEVTGFFLLAVFLWMLKKKKKRFYPVGCIGLVFLIEIAGKLLIQHPSPPEETLRYVPFFHLPASSYFQLHNSFPSGHMARSAFSGVILLFLVYCSSARSVWKHAGSFLVGVFLLVMFVSRISLGIHWFSDVFGGLVLGSAAATLGLSLWNRQELCS